MLWTEKYRPNKIQDVIGQEHFVIDAQNWIEMNEMPNLLLYGNSGIGKTAGAIALSKSLLKEHFKENFFEINASDDRRLETVRTTIKEIAQSGKMGNVPFKIILLDEMDGMTNDSQNALKRIMERYESNVRFIITCNNKTKIIFALQSRCANYHFKPLPFDLVSNVIQRVLSKEGHSLDIEEVEQFIYHFNGDIRRTLTELQACVVSGTRLKIQMEKTLKDYENIVNDILNKNTEKAIDRLHDSIYNGLSIQEICIGIHDYVIQCEMEAERKLKFLRVVGEGEYRATTMTPKLLASWIVAQLI